MLSHDINNPLQQAILENSPDAFNKQDALIHMEYKVCQHNYDYMQYLQLKHCKVIQIS